MEALSTPEKKPLAHRAEDEPLLPQIAVDDKVDEPTKPVSPTSGSLQASPAPPSPSALSDVDSVPFTWSPHGIPRVAIAAPGMSAREAPPPVPPVDNSWLTGLIFHLALSFHSLIAGLALGVDESTDAGLGLCIAILFHKSLAAFALAQKLLPHQREIGNWVYGLLAIFSLTTPVGIAVGLSLSSMVEGHTAMYAILALAAGAFLYVGIVEMLVRDLQKPSRYSRPVLLVCAVVGFAAMSSLSLWT